MNDESDEKGGFLNLGLTDLMTAESTAEEGSQPSDQLDIDSLIQSCIDARGSKSTSAGKDGELDHWQNLWYIGQFQELAQAAERELHRNGDNVQARLWWIRSHRVLKSMPLSMIAAPAEELFRRLDTATLSTVERIIATDTLVELGTACWDNELPERAVQFIRRATQINPEHSTRLASYIAAELTRVRPSELPISERSAAENYRAELEALAKEHQISLESNSSPATKGEQRSSSDSRQSQSFFSLLLAPAKVLALPTLAAGALFIISYGGYSAGYHGGAHVLPAVSFDDQRVVSQTIPMPERKVQQEGPTLWNILRRLENDEAGVATTSVPAAVTFDAGAVNTKLPVEPPELARLITAWDQRELITDSAATGELDIGVPDSATQEVRGDYIVSGYSNLPGTQSTLTTKPGSRTTNASMYSINTTTYVYQHPSSDAPSLAQLEPGNQVEVSEQLGSWLKIVSAQNRIGYIKSDSASPLRP
jgi:hypothetical protein